MNVHDYGEAVTNELKQTLSRIAPEDADRMTDAIIKANKVFLCGAGRTGFMAKAFAMRLMHMGVHAYVIGETVTPNTEKSDLLIICSGSGETGSLISMAQKARKIGAKVALATIFPESTIGKLADVTVQIPAPTPKVESEIGFQSIQPMGSLFEQSLLLFLDIVIMLLMDKRGKDSGTMFKSHANLE